ncbi:MAG TPA: DUF2914 domain-containing protein [Candidatus Paceibacterota bacterium]|nr:DUF2914 domain-containing protein [Candidatus Paceibacterota bacterium]
MSTLSRMRHAAARLREWMKRYERFIVPAALICGFLVDTQIFTRVDLLWNDLLLIAYLLLAAAGIVLVHLADERQLHGWVTRTIAAVMPLVIQFSFGSLFKGLIIFYGESASLAVNWIFVVVLAFLLIVSEVFIHNYRRFPYQMGLWFFLLLSYNAFYLPVLLGRIGPWIFLASIVESAAILVAFIWLLSRLVPKRAAASREFVLILAGGIAAAFAGLYFLGAIPPLPLSLMDAGVAHAVTKEGDAYVAFVEPRPWYDWYESYNTQLHLSDGNPAYVYTSVFAPSRLSLTITHEWQRYDEASGQWVTEATVSFPVNGGRDGGYRGYSMKNDPRPGKWRVNVLTGYGAIIGRVSFSVDAASGTPALEKTAI